MATPEQPRRIDLQSLKPALAEAGFDIVLDARVLLLVRKGAESTVYNTGKVLIKTTDKDQAEAAYADLAPFLDAAEA